jgi:alpha-tubulin suppressor-like RCC1 family protein
MTDILIINVRAEIEMFKAYLVIILGVVLAACGGGSSSGGGTGGSGSGGGSGLTIGGNIVLLQGNIELTLTVDGSQLEVTSFPVANGFFKFNSRLSANSTYQIEVTKNPQGQVCSISRGASGSMPDYSVTNVLINCQEAQFFSIGAFSIPSNVTVQLNQSELKTVLPGMTEVTFETPLSVGASVNLNITEQPEGYECGFNDIGALVDLTRHRYEVYCFALNQPVTNIYRSVFGFSALREDGSMFIWGSSVIDASSVQRNLVNVSFASDSNTSLTMAAVNQSGDLVSWLDEPTGEEASDVEHLLAAGVSGIWKNLAVTSVLTKDGYLVSWGMPEYGGGVYQYVGQDFTQVVSNVFSFAALKTDGSVIAWGYSQNGGSTSGVTAKLQNVKKIVPLFAGYAALTHDGKIVTWPEIETSQSILDRAQTITDIVATKSGVLGIREDGGLVVMGYIHSEPLFIDGEFTNTTDWANTITDAKAIYATESAYAVLKTDNTVISFGDNAHGADYSPVKDDLVNVKEVYPLGTLTQGAFAALKNDGSVVTWGNSSAAGDSFSVSSQLTNVKKIFATEEAYAALKEDGSVVTWGNASVGGSSIFVKDELVNVVDIVANPTAFAAIRSDGSVITWGDPSHGGDSSKVAKQLNR